MINLYSGTGNLQSITHTVKLSWSKLSTIHSNFFASAEKTANWDQNEGNVHIQLCFAQIGKWIDSFSFLFLFTNFRFDHFHFRLDNRFDNDIRCDSYPISNNWGQRFTLKIRSVISTIRNLRPRAEEVDSTKEWHYLKLEYKIPFANQKLIGFSYASILLFLFFEMEKNWNKNCSCTNVDMPFQFIHQFFLFIFY